MRKYTRKTRRQNKKSRSHRKSGKRRVRGGCGSSSCRPMIGGEDPKLSSDIYNYTISNLPHSISA